MPSDNLLQELFGVEGKVVLVTGGSRGIGLAIAEGFTKAGARVYISSRKADVCDAAATDLSRYGEAFSLPADLGTVEGCRSLADALSQREGKLHVLINNAGALWAASLADYPESGWDKVFDINVKGPFFLVQALTPLLKEAATARRSRPNHQRRIHRRLACPVARDLRLHVLKGSAAPLEPAPRGPPRTIRRHR